MLLIPDDAWEMRGRAFCADDAARNNRGIFASQAIGAGARIWRRRATTVGGVNPLRAGTMGIRPAAIVRVLLHGRRSGQQAMDVHGLRSAGALAGGVGGA